jgi:nucleotide-binding universal stress UspA family protein
MKVKPTSTAGQVVVQLGWQDEHLLEESARQAARVPFRLKRILVPIDFSPCARQALQHAVAFAQQFDAKIVLVNVVEPMILPENLMLAVPELPEVGTNLVAAAQQRLDGLAQTELPAAHRLPCLVRVGRPYNEIVGVASEEDIDLIVLSTHGYTGLKHVLLGSTAERVVRHAPCPVLTIRAPGVEATPA